MTLITDLIHAGIIDKNDAADLKVNLKKAGSKPGEPLRTLYLFFEGKVITSPSSGGYMFTMDPLANYDRSPVEYNKATNQDLLDILFKHDVITAAVHQKLKPFVLPGNKHNYLGAVYIASELSAFYQHFTIEKQLEFAQLLSGKDKYGHDGMLDHRKKNKLFRDIKAGKMETYLDFFRYCYGCDFINLRPYQGKSQKLLKKLTGILNSLLYGAFFIKDIFIKEEDFGGEPDYNNKQATITIDTGVKEYDHQYTFSENERSKAHIAGVVLENLLTFINRLLADYTCPYRFTSVVNKLNKQLFPDYEKLYAICLIQQTNTPVFEFYDTQRRFLRNQPNLVVFRFPLSYSHIQYTIYHFRECGLLAHLKDLEFNDIISSIYQDTYECIGDLIIKFPNTIAIVDQTVTPGQKPYRYFLQTLNLISHGVLNFTDIDDGLPDQIADESEEEFKVSFQCGGKQHEVKCNVVYKYFDTAIIYYVINEIIRKDYPGYQLIQFINSNHKQDYYLFASEGQSKYLQKMMLRDAIDRF